MAATTTSLHAVGADGGGGGDDDDLAKLVRVAQPTRTRKRWKAKARPMPSEAPMMTAHAGTKTAMTIGSLTVTMTNKKEKRRI